jgi:glutathione S-transferase
MKLFDYHDAPNPRVVRMFAAEKGITLQCQHVDVARGENHRAPYNTTINRTGQVPALELDDGTVLCEILPICEYLEEIHPEKPLIGATPEERAETRMWTRWIDLKYVERMTEACVVAKGPIRDHYAKFNYKTLLPPEAAETCAKIAAEKLLWFDGEMTGRTFVCGERFTLADVHFFCFLDFFEGLGLGFPREATWISSFYARVKLRSSASA